MVNLPKLNSKNIAKIVLAIVFLSAIKQFIDIYRVKTELISPVVPQNLISEITDPLFYNGLIAATVGIIGSIVYFYKKYKIVMVLGLLTIIWLLYIYPYFYFGD